MLIDVRSTLRHLIVTEGFRGLAKGFSLNVMKGPITMSLSLTTYDLLVAQVNRHRNMSVNRNVQAS
jgi:Mitochondrial carrier protein